MFKPSETTDHTSPTHEPAPATASRPWQVEVSELLARAAGLCADQGADLDAFMKGAWSAYMAARPGLREHLEEMQLRTQLEQLRSAGKLGLA